MKSSQSKVVSSTTEARYLSLTVALRVVRARGRLSDFEQLEEFIAELRTELFSLISDEFQRATEATNPAIEDCFGDHAGLLRGGNHQLHVFSEGICHGQDVSLVCDRGFQRSKQVRMDSLLRLGALGQGREQMGGVWELAAADLALVALLDVLLNVSFHSRPEIALHVPLS